MDKEVESFSLEEWILHLDRKDELESLSIEANFKFLVKSVMIASGTGMLTLLTIIGLEANIKVAVQLVSHFSICFIGFVVSLITAWFCIFMRQVQSYNAILMNSYRRRSIFHRKVSLSKTLEKTPSPIEIAKIKGDVAEQNSLASFYWEQAARNEKSYNVSYILTMTLLVVSGCAFLTGLLFGINIITTLKVVEV